MNPAAALASVLRRQFPTVSVQSDISESGESIGFVDIVTAGGLHLAIECDDSGGFGLSMLPTYREAPGETFDDLPPLLDRIRDLIVGPGGRVIELLDRRLDEMFAHPGDLWGSSEAYELQVLLLLELRFFPGDRPRLMREYFAFFGPLFPDLGARPLFSLSRLDHADHVALSRLLGAFRQRLSGTTPQLTPSMFPQKP